MSLSPVLSTPHRHFPLAESLSYGSQTLFSKDILKNCGAIVFCLDAQDEPYTDGLELLLDTMIQVNETEPDISFHVFIHKIDGDLFMSTEAKIGAYHPTTPSQNLNLCPQSARTISSST